MAFETLDDVQALISVTNAVRSNAELYVAAAERINRDAEERIRQEVRGGSPPIPESADNVPIIRDTDELVRRAEIWLSDRGRLDAIEAGLGRYTVLPLPNRPITPSQVFDAWADARKPAPRNNYGEVMTWERGRGSTLGLRHPEPQSPESPLGSGASRSREGHVAFLGQWPANALSGFDEAAYEDAENYKTDGTTYYDGSLSAVRFVAVELATDEPRLSSGSEELLALRGLQAEHPRLRSASLFEVEVLNRKYMTGRPFNYPNGFNDTFARAVELEELVGEFEDLPAAFIGEDGAARIGGVANVVEAPVRRAVA